jgi:hypothetical protein
MFTAIAFIGISSPLLAADPVWGTYVEARTCQVYTGPCFANGEVGSVGKDAIMTWHIKGGSFSGVDLAGQSVAVVVKASHTLGFNGFDDAAHKQAVVIISSSAGTEQAGALKAFALSQTGIGEQEVAAVQVADIEMQFDMTKLTATVEVGEFAHLETRKARPGDCICSNESAYYPPLAKLKGFVPGVTIEGEIAARRLGTRWSIPDSRTAYLGTFEVDSAELQLAKSF